MQFHKIETFHTRPGKIIVAGLVVIGLFFGGLGGIAATLPFSGAVIAPGVVKISEERKTVQHLEGGIVDRIFVREGDAVKQGDVLVRLKSSQILSGVDMLEGILITRKVQADRLTAEKSMLPAIQWSAAVTAKSDDPEVQRMMREETEIFTSGRTTLLSRMEIHRSRIRQLEEQIIGAEEELAARGAIVTSLKEEIKNKEPLLKDHYLSQSDLMVLKRTLDENTGLIAVKKQKIAESREKIAEIKLGAVDLQNSYRETAVSELGKLNDAVFELKERLKPQQDALARLDITAPVSGIVINLRIHSEKGGVIRPGEPILDIVPDGARLIIEAKLRQDKITSVKAGQTTKIQLSAFNRITTPPLDATIIYVSPDTRAEETSLGIQSFYIVHAVPLENELEKHNAYLASGMPAACFIETEQRTFLQYLLEPIMLNMDRSLRESL